MSLPPFPVDPATLDLVERACLGQEGAERSSVGDVCQLYSEMAGSDLAAVEEELGDDVVVLRDPQYHHNDIILALITEVRHLRGGA